MSAIEKLSHSPFKTGSNGLWFSYNDYLQKKFNERVYKITVSAGFTCPTRDGTKGQEGCAFCDERGSSSFFAAEKAADNIQKQVFESLPNIKSRFNAKKFLAYFQSFTNTYGPISYLKEVYDGALNIPDVIGMAVGTRPDCIPGEVLHLLNQYAKNRYVSLEIGIQSFRDDALDFYNRGHSVAEAIEGTERAIRFPNLNVSAHLMFGAPGDCVQTAIEAAQKINALKVHGVKIHQLMVLKNTSLAKRYAISPWNLLSIDEYNQMAMAFLEHLNPEIHVERTHALTSHPDELIGPHWSGLRFEAFNHLRKLMIENDSYQGKKFIATT